MTEKLLVVKKVEQISDLALRKTGAAADEMVMDYASEAGDERALEVVKQLEPEVMARIVREHDVTKPSFLSLISRPEDAISIFEEDSTTWSNLSGMNPGEIDALMRDVSDVVTGIILSREDDAWREEVFNLLADSESAMMYVAAPLMARLHSYEYDGVGTYLIRFEYPYASDGEVGHVWRLMKELSPHTARMVGDIVSGHREENVDDLIFDVRAILAGLQNEKIDELTDTEKEMFEIL